MEKLISIIVPIYDVEEYLIECLESIRRNIAGLEAEVLLIDDGSNDSSSVIAKSYANREEKFNYYRKENGGLSNARNYGVSLASGKYLFFVDSDDLLTDGILPKMFETAERNDTELTVCNVARYKDRRIFESYLHVRAFHGLRDTVLHVTNYPNFIYDSTSWNKLILRSFYLKYGISFPEGFLYEDMLPNFKLHYLCNGVSVIRDTGYLWRQRTEANKQITQDHSKKPLTDKIEMMRQTLDYIRENVTEPEIEETVVIKFLGHDFDGWLNQLRLLTEEEAKEYVQLIRGFAALPVNRRYLHKLPLLKQQLYQDIFEGNFSHLLQIINYMNKNYSNVPVFTTRNGLVVKVPGQLFKIRDRDGSRECGNQALPSCSIDSVTINGADIYLQGHLYIRRISIPYTGMSYVKVILLNENTGSTFMLPVSPVRTADLTKLQGSILNYDDYTYYQYDYDGAGFGIHIDFGKFAHGKEFAGKNYIILSYDFTYCKGDWLLKGIARNEKRALEQYIYKNDTYTGRVVFDSQNIISLVLMDKKTEKQNQIIHRAAAIPFHNTVTDHIKEFMEERCLQKYITARMDVKNYGMEENGVAVVKISDLNAKIQKPAWFKNAQGQGCVIQSTKGDIEIEIACIGNGELMIWLRGMDCRNEKDIRFPVWISGTCFRVDGKELFNNPHLVCHDKPFVYNMKVTNGQIVKIYMEWRPAVDILAKERESNLKRIAEMQQETIHLGKTVAGNEKKLKETQQEVTQLERMKTKTEKELQNVKNGWSFKIGRIITYIPRIIIKNKRKR